MVLAVLFSSDPMGPEDHVLVYLVNRLFLEVVQTVFFFLFSEPFWVAMVVILKEKMVEVEAIKQLMVEAAVVVVMVLLEARVSVAFPIYFNHLMHQHLLLLGHLPNLIVSKPFLRVSIDAKEVFKVEVEFSL